VVFQKPPFHFPYQLAVAAPPIDHHHSITKLELGLRRVSDCELYFLARVPKIDLWDLFPRQVPLKTIGPMFQSGKRKGKRNAISPIRGDK